MNVFDNSNSWLEMGQQGSPLSFRRRRCSDSLKHDHFLALDTCDRYLYMLRMPNDITDVSIQCLPSVSGCINMVFSDTSGSYFCLILKKNDDWPVFKLLIQMLIKELEQTKYQQKAFLRTINSVLTRCRSFFKNKSNGLTRSQALGLLGELFFLQNYVIPVIGWSEAISCWRGPLGNPQDFTVGDTCIEIKTTESSEKHEVRISNLDQLDPMNGEVYLYVLCVGSGAQHMSGSTCLKCVQEELSEGFKENTGDDSMLIRLLSILGYSPSCPEANRYYTLTGQTFYAIEKDFPRLSHTSIPNGITSAQYTISLDTCKHFIKQPDWISHVNEIT